MDVTADILELDVEVNHFIVEMPIYSEFNQHYALEAVSEIVLFTLIDI